MTLGDGEHGNLNMQLCTCSCCAGRSVKSASVAWKSSCFLTWQPSSVVWLSMVAVGGSATVNVTASEGGDADDDDVCTDIIQHNSSWSVAPA